MLKRIYLLLTVLCLFTFSNAQNFNFTLQGTLPYPSDALSNIWGWWDNAGNEYALVGTESGLSIVDVTNPTTPTELFLIPGPSSIWREVRTHDHYAYVTTEGGGGLTIVDLSQLPTAAPYTQYTGDGAIAGQLDNIHSLHIDDGYIYLHGSNLFNGTAIICDLNADPWNPTYLSNIGGTYVHDGMARGNYYYPCHIYQGEFAVVDVTNKSNPSTINAQPTPGLFTHNSWLSTNSQVLFTTDEVQNSFLTSYDVTNPNNISELDRMQVTPGSQSIIHNTYVIEKNGTDYAVSSWYKDGTAIADVERPDNMVFIGWFDTYVQGGGNGFNGAWGVYMYLPSGNVLVSDIDNGLYVLTPTYVRACYLEGIVTDSITGLPINNALVEILNTNITKNSKITGDYKTGYYQSGNYDIRFSRNGYVTKTITGVSLANGVVTNLNVQLAPIGISVTLNGQVIDNANGNPVPNALVNFVNTSFTYNTTADALGNFSIPGFFVGSYDYVAGAWGYISECGNITINTGGGANTIALDKGYYDDFALDFGWTNTGAANDWTRGEPIGTTTNGGNPANPDFDSNTDCLDQAYVTGNAAGGAADHDVDPNDGTVTLTSPVFDLSNYINPYISYERWFVNAALNGNQPNDEMNVKLTNGITTVTLENLLPSSPGNGSWIVSNWQVNQLITPTANMQVMVETFDNAPGSIVEGGFDKFMIVEGPASVANVKDQIASINVSPNPFESFISINYSLLNGNCSGSFLRLTDIAGKEMMRENLTSVAGTLIVNKRLNAGIYYVNVVTKEGTSSSLKIVKTK